MSSDSKQSCRTSHHACTALVKIWINSKFRLSYSLPNLLCRKLFHLAHRKRTQIKYSFLQGNKDSDSDADVTTLFMKEETRCLKEHSARVFIDVEVCCWCGWSSKTAKRVSTLHESFRYVSCVSFVPLVASEISWSLEHKSSILWLLFSILNFPRFGPPPLRLESNLVREGQRRRNERTAFVWTRSSSRWDQDQDVKHCSRYPKEIQQKEKQKQDKSPPPKKKSFKTCHFATFILLFFQV